MSFCNTTYGHQNRYIAEYGNFINQKARAPGKLSYRCSQVFEVYFCNTTRGRCDTLPSIDMDSITKMTLHNFGTVKDLLQLNFFRPI